MLTFTLYVAGVVGVAAWLRYSRQWPWAVGVVAASGWPLLALLLVWLAAAAITLALVESSFEVLLFYGLLAEIDPNPCICFDGYTCAKCRHEGVDAWRT